MTAQELEQRIMVWARSHPDVAALVQIGSRARTDGQVDAWSDWDYHLYVSNPARFLNDSWPVEIAPYWSAVVERTERGVGKVSVLFTGGYEVDFVPLVDWQMKLVYWAMARPALRAWYPATLVEGIDRTRLFVKPGYRVMVGGTAWERRLRAVGADWPDPVFSELQFRGHFAGFWRHAVWVQKKISRGELRAAQRWNHREVQEHLLALLVEEARLAGRPARPEARRAEQWLETRRVVQTAFVSVPEQHVLARTLLAEIDLFEEVARSVGLARGFAVPEHTALSTWLRAELAPLAGPP